MSPVILQQPRRVFFGVDCAARSAEELVQANRSAIRTTLGKSKQLALALAAPDFADANVTFATLDGYVFESTAPTGAWIYAGDWSTLPGYVQGFLDGSIAGNA